MVFFNLSFTERECLNWKFNSTSAKVKLKPVFEKFVRWQGTPETYIKGLSRHARVK
jgi:hypothetical protein